MLRRFIGAVLPSMLAFAFSGLYTIVDGFFIGRNIGDIGLAAVNIAYPLAALVQAVGTGIGMGGAVWISLYRGKGDREREEECLGNTLTTLFWEGFCLWLSCLHYAARSSDCQGQRAACTEKPWYISVF